MPYIIAATDFSTTSDNAVNYAANLAVIHNADLVIVHAFAFPVMVSDVPMPGSLIDDTQHDAEERIKEMQKHVSETYPDINIKSAVTYGNLVETIGKYADEHGKPWLTVMGNSNTQEDTAWFFSSLKEATHRLNYSVLAVPPMAHFKPIRKICFGIDLAHVVNKAALAKLADVCMVLKPELHVFNAQVNAFNQNHIPEISEETKEILADAQPHYHVRYEVNIDDSIREFCSSVAIDWLAIQPGKYPFVEGLFHKSHTKAMANSIDIPLLILHEGN